MRAILLTGEASDAPSGTDILRCGYAPHSLLFPHAAAIVHHGGIGTTGQALRAGKPQIIVPHMDDQYDNGSRIERLGVGRMIAVGAFQVDAAAAILSSLLADEQSIIAARRMGERVAMEDGAHVAAKYIERLLPR
jgi:rhamnosyltransferase subunit B